MTRIAHRVSVPDPAVDIWRVPLAVSASELEQLSMLLSRDEHMRAARFQFARDRDRSIVARGMLRVLLGNHLGLPPEAIALETGPHGKPLLVAPPDPVHFNLSHSGDLAIYAIARDCVPGVDIEYLGREVDLDALARRFFSARECAELQLIPHAERKRTFLACWTCKEAIAKATGRGLRVALNRIEVTVDPAAPPQVFTVPEGDAREWQLHRIDAGSAHVTTLATYRSLKI